MKRIVTMQDISCVGKCSLTAALPVLSAMGLETAVLPTAVLSSHTMFKHVSFCDLTDQIPAILHAWNEEHFTFSAIYTGYLGSAKQISYAMDLFDQFGKDALILVDPCMADHGKLYRGFSMDFVQQMKQLCRKASIICPNLTEACLLLGIPYQESFSGEELQSMLRKLADLGCSTAVLTGISTEIGKIGSIAYSRTDNTFHEAMTEKEPQQFHGTGDLWASTFLGALCRGKKLPEAMQIACSFVQKSIACTLQEPDHNRYGVNFEQALPDLIQMTFTKNV